MPRLTLSSSPTSPLNPFHSLRSTSPTPIQIHFSPPHPISISYHSCRSSTLPLPWRKPLLSSDLHVHTPLRLRSNETETAETIPDESEFIEIGYICNVHGLKGDLRVKPTTDFPQLRFAEPGRRWLRVPIFGKGTIREVELMSGRGGPGQKNWILSFSGIDSIDKAKQIVGSTLLVREEDRPKLEEGEFYIPDLVGMRVVLKETGKPVGTVVNVFNSGASDLLQVMLSSSEEKLGGSDSSGPLVWVPFVEAIVPDVDMDRREMQITPPKGLLELNLRSDGRSKKERRQLEWKQRKKFQQRLIAAKKKLYEIGQQHLVHGLSAGEKGHKISLAKQIVDINIKLFQHALYRAYLPNERFDLSEFVNANSAKLLKNTLTISKEYLGHHGSKENSDKNHDLFEKGLHLLSQGKVAIILAVNGNNNRGRDSQPNSLDSSSTSNTLILQALFHNNQKFLNLGEEKCSSIILIIICPAHEVQSFQELFADHDYFGLDTEKVMFLEEEKLPVVSSSLLEEGRRKILLKSPWEIHQSPMGSGGIFSSLVSHNILDNLAKIGVEYVQLCSLDQRSAVGCPLFFGLINAYTTDIAIKIFNDKEDEYCFDMISSISFLKKMSNQLDKFDYHIMDAQNSHVEKVDGEWVEIEATSFNSHQLWCSIYSSLNFCSPDKISVLRILD